MKILAAQLFLSSELENSTVYVTEFEKTEKGRWLKEHSYKQITYDIVADPSTFAYKVISHAWLTEQNLTFYTLKWS